MYHEYADTIRETAARLAALPAGRARVVRLAEILPRFSPADAACFIEAVYMGAIDRRASAVLVLQSMADRRLWRFDLDRDFVRDVYMWAEESERPFVADVLVPPPHERPGKPPAPHRDFAEASLGVRRSMAKHADVNRLEKLLVDPSPLVVRALLDNPRVVLNHVLTIATKRPTVPEVLQVVHDHPRWGRAYEVRKALVANPFTPNHLVLTIVPTLKIADLYQLAYGERTSHRLIQTVLALRSDRRAAAAARGARPVGDRPAEAAREAELELARALGDATIEATEAELDETALLIPGAFEDDEPEDGGPTRH